MPPFAESDSMKTYSRIVKGIDVVEFPRITSGDASSLIKALCRNNPSERLCFRKMKRLQEHE
jgi:cGMP-dependent protein kinase